jgi:threonylcarbamoyladenosine tRNA methylthiotransferase MtaB
MEKLSARKIKPGSGIFFDFTGCKLNRHDIELMRSQSEKLGLHPVKDIAEADVVVLDTCCVTIKAARSSRSMIRRYRRLRADSYIVVTGCYSEIEKEEVRTLGVDMLIHNSHKEEFINFIGREIEFPQLTAENKQEIKAGGIVDHFFAESSLQSRPYLKIQDGCNFFCSYCIIPFARGLPRSVPKAEVLAQVRLLAAGFPEMNLCGVNLGRYSDGADYGLYELLCDVVGVPELGKIRLSSIEPVDMDDRMINLVIESDKICKNLHIPLQGGTDRLLSEMGRRYTLAQYREIVTRIKTRNPDFCLGADVITGFPGETADEFSQVLENVRSLPLDYLHVFTYSPRPGTVAEKMPDQVSGEDKKQRTALLYQLSAEKFRAFKESQLGKQTMVVIERGRFDKCLKGLSTNYLPVYIETGDDSLVLKEHKVLLKQLFSDGLLGEIC